MIQDATQQELQRKRAHKLGITWKRVEEAMVWFGVDAERAIDLIMSVFRDSARESQRERAHKLGIPWEAVEAAVMCDLAHDEEHAIDYIMSNYRYSARDSLAAVIRANNRVRRTRAEK